MDVPEENLLAMKRHDMEGVERDGGKAGYMTELVELTQAAVGHKGLELVKPPPA